MYFCRLASFHKTDIALDVLKQIAERESQGLRDQDDNRAVTIGVAAGSVVRDQWSNNKFRAVMAALSFLFAVLVVVGMPAQMQMDDDAGYISHFQLMLDEQMMSVRPDHKLMAHYILQIHKLHKIDDFVARLRFPPHFGR